MTQDELELIIERLTIRVGFLEEDLKFMKDIQREMLGILAGRKKKRFFSRG